MDLPKISLPSNGERSVNAYCPAVPWPPLADSADADGGEWRHWSRRPHRFCSAGPTKKFGGISGADEAMAERVDQSPMRQVAHFCVTLRRCRDRKDAEIAAVRALFGRKSAVESPKWRKSPPAQRLTPSLQMLQKCSIVAHSVHSASHPKIRGNSGNDRLFPARRCCRRPGPRCPCAPRRWRLRSAGVGWDVGATRGAAVRRSAPNAPGDER
jgi:hypothetical protein